MLFGHNNAQHDMLGIHDYPSKSLSYYLFSHEPFSSKRFAFVVKTNFSYFNEIGHMCAVVLIVVDHCNKNKHISLQHNT